MKNINFFGLKVTSFDNDVLFKKIYRHIEEKKVVYLIENPIELEKLGKDSKEIV